MVVNWRLVALNARALAVGAVTGASLCGGYVAVQVWLSVRSLKPGQSLFIPPDAQVTLAAIYAAMAASVIAIVCAPIWVVLERRGLAGWRSAALLGFVAPLAYLVAIDPRAWGEPLHMLTWSLPWAGAGVLAGLTTWALRPRNPSALSPPPL